MITVQQSPMAQIREARWWLKEVRLDLPPGCTTQLVTKTRRWVADLIIAHVRGQLEPREYVVDETIGF